MGGEFGFVVAAVFSLLVTEMLRFVDCDVHATFFELPPYSTVSRLYLSFYDPPCSSRAFSYGLTKWIFARFFENGRCFASFRFDFLFFLSDRETSSTLFITNINKLLLKKPF